MKKDNTITVFYDEVTQRDIYRLNGVDVTDTIEMLKDKWERQILDTRCRLFQLDMSIQQRLQKQLAITEKALELASETIKQMCGKPLWIGGNMLPPEPKDSKYFKDIAKEMLENE